MLKARIAGCLLALSLCTPAAAVTYNVTVLGSLDGTTSTAWGINDLGRTVGVSTFGTRAVVWNGTTPTELGSLDAPPSSLSPSVAFKINNAGQVVGYSSPSPGVNEAVVWNGTTPTVLSSPVPGAIMNRAMGINDVGQVVGSSYSIGLGVTQEAVVWNGATPTILGSLGGKISGASAINNAGQIVGASATSNGSPQAVIWNGTTPTVLGSLGGAISSAGDINNAGQVVGLSTTASSSIQQAVLWNGTAPTALGSLGEFNSSATGINDVGQVIGWSEVAPGNRRGTIWDGTTAIDINTLLASGPSGLVIASLLDINSLGQIVGSARDASGNLVGVLLTPVVAQTPLPAALPLFASGLGALWFAGRRRKRKTGTGPDMDRPLRLA